jgi:Uncharacterized protein involved in biosynthesis of c-type cytochromes|tara:strand:+ start:1492 stop:1866 length:375 start_codon:yes stop_codon:yes gene_type:complete
MKYQYFFRYIFYFFFIFYSNSALSIDNLNDKVKKLTLELRCMTCQNQSVYDSDSDFAKDITTLVEDKFKEGLSEKEIKVFLTKRYGEYILFKPYFNIKNLLLWLFPFILLILSLGFFIKGLKKY